MLRNERGGSRFGVYVFFALLILVVHVGFKVVPMYMDYGRMQDEMEMKAGLAQFLKDGEIVRDLTQKARELDLPLNEESFVLDRNDETRRMSIRTKAGWDVELQFLGGYYTRTFHFDPSVNESYANVMR